MRVYKKRSIRGGFVVELLERDLDGSADDVLLDNNLFRRPTTSEELIDRTIHELNTLSQQAEV